MKIVLELRPPLPATTEEMRARLQKLLDYRRAIDEEIRAIIGSNVDLAQKRECLRCGHSWVPKKLAVVMPVVCARCKSRSWNRPRIYRQHKKAFYGQGIVEPVKEFYAELESLRPPPAAPESLAERLKALQTASEPAADQPETEEETLDNA